jgi:amino-acid N-acetyltransferase
MPKVNKLSRKERETLKHLLKSDQLCFNDINQQGVHLFGVTYKDEVIGYFGYELFDNQALFRSMVVVPAARDKGYGSLIWDQAKKKLVAEKVNEVYLLTNTAAPFFSKQGFAEVPRSLAPEAIANTNEFIEFCPEDSVFMKIDLR